MSVKQEVFIEDSYQYCLSVTREKATNFHYAFKILSDQDRYRGICALYAFARIADDYSDEENDPEKALANAVQLRRDFDNALDGNFGSDPILPAVVDTIKRYRIPAGYFHELIAGTEMDARIKRYQTWQDSRLYCYRVASVIGMMTIHVFGFREPEGSGQNGSSHACDLAERTGIAFQLTNILRDIREDAERDRLYLPLEDLARFGLTEEQVMSGDDSPAFRELVKFELNRAREYYKAAPELVPLIDPGSQRAIGALVEIYRRLLDEIERRDYDVLSERVSLSRMEKIAIAGSATLKTLLKI